MAFKDYFSKQSDTYLKARPTYPDELFAYLATLTPGKNLCWDCATGNGQAAISLVKYFDKVIATDGSEKQIANAMQQPGIEYRVGTAEESGLESRSIDLIAVATGAHWFNLDLFYAEAKRIAKRNGALAIWTYSSPTINYELDELTEWFAYDFLYRYWPDGRWYVRNQYKDLPFPFKAIPTPDFWCQMHWSKEQWLNYIRSWSSYTNYVTQHSKDPISQLLPKLNPLWPDDVSMDVRWPLHLKCAKLNTPTS